MLLLNCNPDYALIVKFIIACYGTVALLRYLELLKLGKVIQALGRSLPQKVEVF